MTKRQIKKDFKAGIIGYSDAIPLLMFDFDMTLGESRDYLDN